MANAEQWRKINLQGYRFEKWCCEYFNLIPSQDSYEKWKIYKLVRKKWKTTTKISLDAYDESTGYEIECKSTSKQKTFQQWKNGKTNWTKLSPAQNNKKNFLVIVGLIEEKKVKDWVILEIIRTKTHEITKVRLEKNSN